MSQKVSDNEDEVAKHGEDRNNLIESLGNA